MKTVGAPALKAWLHDGAEIAFLDLREHGQYGEAHPLMVVSLPFSRLESRLEQLLPNPRVRVVLMDDGGMLVAARVAAIMERCGYSDVSVLEGGIEAWKAAGYSVFAGVNVYSKAFGELAAEIDDVPQIAPEALRARIQRGDNIVVVDGRPVSEYQKMNIPGSICCPGGELVLRIGEIAPDPATTVVVNCAGRTRSIIGAASLRRFGVANEVVALRNGTMGWRLAGFDLEHGSRRLFPAPPQGARRAALRARAAEIARQKGIEGVSGAQVAAWRADCGRTTYLLDVRTEEEFRAGSWPGAAWAPGGQLVQATDEWVAVRHARLVLVDPDRIRSVVVAQWLAEMGWDACYLDEDLPAASAAPSAACRIEACLPPVEILPAAALPALLAQVDLLDIRPAMRYRAGHVCGARWAIRPRLEAALRPGDGRPVVLVCADPVMGRAVAGDIARLGRRVSGMLLEDEAAWCKAGLRVEATPDDPADEDCIDFLFFVHDRHDGNNEAARRYLQWELDLLARMDEAERRSFRLAHHG